MHALLAKRYGVVRAAAAAAAAAAATAAHDLSTVTFQCPCHSRDGLQRMCF
jgi:hypothetical protein